MANIYKKTMREALEQARNFRDTKPTEVSEGNLSYDEWLKQVKGIEKGAHGINSDEHAKYSKEWKAYANTSESKLTEIVGGHGEMTITKDGGVMIIKSKDWQTYKAKGWAKKTNESLDLTATGDTITSNASQEVEGEELDEVHFSNRNEPSAPKGMHKLRSGRDIPSTPQVDKIHKKVVAMTDRNDHSGARIEIAKACGDKKLVQIYNALELAHDNYSGAVGNGAIELRNKFSPVLNKAIERKFGKYADVIQDAL